MGYSRDRPARACTGTHAQTKVLEQVRTCIEIYVCINVSHIIYLCINPTTTRQYSNKYRSTFGIWLENIVLVKAVIVEIDLCYLQSSMPVVRTKQKSTAFLEQIKETLTVGRPTEKGRCNRTRTELRTLQFCAHPELQREIVREEKLLLFSQCPSFEKRHLETILSSLRSCRLKGNCALPKPTHPSPGVITYGNEGARHGGIKVENSFCLVVFAPLRFASFDVRTICQLYRQKYSQQ